MSTRVADVSITTMLFNSEDAHDKTQTENDCTFRKLPTRTKTVMDRIIAK